MTTFEPAATPSRTPTWIISILAAAVIAIIAVAIVAAAKVQTTPVAQVVTQTSAEQSFLRVTKPATANTDATLRLGHHACQTMNSGQRTYSEYRLAIGQLMAAGESPSAATAIVHGALISGLCTER